MADLPPPPAHDNQHWPCGPDCEYARPMPGSYDDWHWCSHPSHGGRLVRDGRECSRYRAATSQRNPAKPEHWLQ